MCPKQRTSLKSRNSTKVELFGYIFNHTATVLFLFSELSQSYGSSVTECGICGINLKTELSLLRHLAGIHNSIEKLLLTNPNLRTLCLNKNSEYSRKKNNLTKKI